MKESGNAYIGTTNVDTKLNIGSTDIFLRKTETFIIRPSGISCKRQHKCHTCTNMDCETKYPEITFTGTRQKFCDLLDRIIHEITCDNKSCDCKVDSKINKSKFASFGIVEWCTQENQNEIYQSINFNHVKGVYGYKNYSKNYIDMTVRYSNRDLDEQIIKKKALIRTIYILKHSMHL